MSIEEIRADYEEMNKEIRAGNYNTAMDIMFKLQFEVRQNTRDMLSELDRLTAENSNLRNELCYKCGRYKEAHNGACNGCRWRGTEDEYAELQ